MKKFMVVLVLFIIIGTAGVFLINKTTDFKLSKEDTQAEDNTITNTENGNITYGEKNTITYRDPKGMYEYSYPSNWDFISNRQGIGLYPKDSKYDKSQGELLTIFSDTSSLSAKEWAVSYDGSGYSIEKEMKINGYDVYYVVNENPSFKDIKYTFSSNGLIIHTNFREIDNSTSNRKDNSNFVNDMESIIQSIKFLN